MRLLIAGWQGQLASALVELVPARDDVSSFAVGRPALDLCEQPTLQRALSDALPDVIVNAAAYTDVDAAESDADAAFALNRDGARMMAEAAAQKNIPIVHLSTDYVFDGTLDRPYRENDSCAPQTVYGRSKLEGELAVAVANPRHVILRTAWVYSAGKKNFVRSILSRAAEQSSIDVVTDQNGSPTYAPDLATVVLDVAAAVAGRGEEDLAWGTYHAAGTEHASWFDLAEAVMAASAMSGGPVAQVNAISREAYPTKAPRLANARLDCAKLDDVFGRSVRPWTEAVPDCVARMLADEVSGL